MFIANIHSIHSKELYSHTKQCIYVQKPCIVQHIFSSQTPPAANNIWIVMMTSVKHQSSPEAITITTDNTIQCLMTTISLPMCLVFRFWFWSCYDIYTYSSFKDGHTVPVAKQGTWRVESKHLSQPPGYLPIIANKFNYKNYNNTKNRRPIPQDLNIMLSPYKFSLQATVDHHW